MIASPLVRAAAATAALFTAACLPADESLPLGSVDFQLGATDATLEGVSVANTVDGDFSLTVTRSLLSFKTVTLGQADDPKACSHRGDPVVADVVFDPRQGADQVFNGLEPDDCPAVGMRFGPPDEATAPAAGATIDDVADLVSGDALHALVDVEARRADGQTWTIQLRFPTAETSSTFGGCAGATPGVQVIAGERQDVTISLDVEAFFRETPDPAARMNVAPFVDSDANGDHVVTMTELDATPLLDLQLVYGQDTYVVPGASATSVLTLAGFAREQFKHAFAYEGDGWCSGDQPGGP